MKWDEVLQWDKQVTHLGKEKDPHKGKEKVRVLFQLSNCKFTEKLSASKFKSQLWP